jgi:hypothetical protein
MKKLRTQSIGIDQGDLVLFSDFDIDGPMWTGEGPRESRARVQFSEAFHAPPAVKVGLTMWDISNGANARADVAAEEVTEHGFDLRFRTWGDTRIARVRIGWQAIGPMKDDEMWDVE